MDSFDFTLNLPLAFTVSGREDGGQGGALRLDAALATPFPCLGLRARRRLWEWCLITVNGRPREPGFALRPGDRVELSRRPVSGGPGDHAGPGGLFCPDDFPPPLAESAEFIAIAKKSGLHSAAIAASPRPSLEGMLAAAWPLLRPDERAPLLLTRLDAATSGLLLAAKNAAAAAKFREYERRGLVDKTYCALLLGRLEQTLCIDRMLNSANRCKTLALDRPDPDPARHTYVEPLDWRAENNASGQSAHGRALTLVRVRIKRGARHQIRAHLSFAGYPVFGDRLYAPQAAGPRLFLHHAQVEFPGFSAYCAPGAEFEAPSFSAGQSGASVKSLRR